MAMKVQTKVALALGAGVLATWMVGSAVLGDGDAKASEHLVNRAWIDHMPNDNRDMVQHLVVLDHSKGKFGAIGVSSSWRHVIEVFRWRQDGDRLSLYFPQDQVRAAVGVRTWRCEGEAPAPFQLCLELRTPKGERVTLYSRSDWEIRPGDVADSIADIVDDYPALAGVFDELSDAEVEILGDADLDGADAWPLRSLSPR